MSTETKKFSECIAQYFGDKPVADKHNLILNSTEVKSGDYIEGQTMMYCFEKINVDDPDGHVEVSKYGSRI